jgi:hypothetical protein
MKEEDHRGPEIIISEGLLLQLYSISPMVRTKTLIPGTR